MSAATPRLDTKRDARVSGSTLTGTGVLLRFALRRDRIRIPIWIAAISLSLIATAMTFPEIYGEAADRQARAALMSNPAAIAIGGPQIGLDDYTFGAMLTNEMLSVTAVVVALMSILMMVRHTRTEEEAGRTELIRASVTGRHAQLAAALVLTVLVNVVLAVVTAVGLAGLGIESIDWHGSWLFSLALAAVGITFAAVAAVTAQVTEHARGASGMAGLALGVAFALRAVGDIGTDALSWLSPIGWALRTYAFVDNRWWPLLPALGLTAVLVATALVLGARRDVGAGLRPPRPGPPTASDRLATPLGLVLRLQRGSLIGWTVAMLAFGLVFGTLVGEVESFAAEIELMQDMFGDLEAELVDAFLGLLVSLFAMTTGFYAVQAALRARAEELSRRAEPVLATAVSRTRWLMSHLGVAMVGSAVILLAGVLGLGVSAAVTSGDAGVIGQLLAAGLVYVAPLLLTVGIAAALFGLVPTASSLVWVVVAYGLVVGMLGSLLGLPEWTLEISPFGAVPMLPGEAFELTPVLVVVALAVLLTLAGVAGFRRRDLTTNA